MYWMTRLSHPILIFYSLMAWAYSRTTMLHSSGSSCERVEHEDTWVSGSMRSHFHTWIGHHRVLTLTPLKVFGVKGKDWKNGLTLRSSIQNLGQRLMQLWMEINVVTLHFFFGQAAYMLPVYNEIILMKHRILQKKSRLTTSYTFCIFIIIFSH